MFAYSTVGTCTPCKEPNIQRAKQKAQLHISFPNVSTAETMEQKLSSVRTMSWDETDEPCLQMVHKVPRQALIESPLETMIHVDVSHIIFVHCVVHGRRQATQFKVTTTTCCIPKYSQPTCRYELTHLTAFSQREKATRRNEMRNVDTGLSNLNLPLFIKPSTSPNTKLT